MRLPVVKLKRYTLAILAHKILSMWATSKEWVVFINKRLLILTVKVAFAKLYTMIKCYHTLKAKVYRCCILTDRGSEYCGKEENHDYELYLAINDIEHSKTKVKHPQTNGICERFHKTILQEFYQVAFRKKIYTV